MAQKIVLEIKDKLTQVETTTNLVVSKRENNMLSNETLTQTITVLESLGYNKNEYTSALDTAITQMKKDNAEELLKEVLKILSIF